MRLVISWLRDFVDVPAPAEEIAAKLGVRGFEVAAVEPLADSPRPPWQNAGGPDGVVDFEITANRPDCLSVLGLAREVATAFDVPLKLPSSKPGARIVLEPTPIDDMARVAFAGGVMPQKSTDFYPKLLSGVTIYKL